MRSLLGLPLALLLCGCKADLVPISKGDPPFCGPNASAVVVVRNMGDADAGPSKTRATFAGSATPVTRDTPAIPKGGSVEVVLDEPADASCGGSATCGIDVVVDADGEVDEASESNNKGSGYCVP